MTCKEWNGVTSEIWRENQTIKQRNVPEARFDSEEPTSQFNERK